MSPSRTRRCASTCSNQLPYFLPHLLALSASSPFWAGERTGLRSYRLSVFNELPRTGLPPTFSDPEEYRRTVATLVSAGELEDGSKLWWDLRPLRRSRPSPDAGDAHHRRLHPPRRRHRHCRRLPDRCLARMLWRLRRANQRWREYSTFLLNENRWLAQRHGPNAALIDLPKGKPVAFAQLLDETIAFGAEDAWSSGCTAEVADARRIVKEGTSADRQLAVYDRAVAAGQSAEGALKTVCPRFNLDLRH